MLQLIGWSLRKKHWYQSLIKLQSVVLFWRGIQLLPFHLLSNVAVQNLSGLFSETQDSSMV